MCGATNRTNIAKDVAPIFRITLCRWCSTVRSLDSQVGSNVLGRLSHDHAIHHLPFTLGQGREAGGHLIALGAIAGHLLAVGQNPVDALSQRLGAHRLLQEVGCALSHRLHRQKRGRHSRSGR